MSRKEGRRSLNETTIILPYRNARSRTSPGHTADADASQVQRDDSQDHETPNDRTSDDPRLHAGGLRIEVSHSVLVCGRLAAGGLDG